MSITDGQPVNAVYSNAAWLSKTSNDTTVGTVAVHNTSVVASGYFTDNVQRGLNTIYLAIGLVNTGNGTAEADATGTTYGAPASTILNTDGHKQALIKLAFKFDPLFANGGHVHDGSAGNGGPIVGSSISGITAGAVTFGGPTTYINYDAANLFWDATNFRLGIRNATPNTSLDVNGDMAIYHSDQPTAASITALPTSTSFVRLTGSTATALHGIASGFDGKILILANVSSVTVTIKHQSGSASAADRIICPTGADMTLAANNNTIFIYDSVQSRWLVVSSSSGGGGGGGGTLNVSTKTANYTVTTADSVIIGDASGGDFTLTLPTASGNSGVHFYFKNKASGTVTIAAQGGEFIDDQAYQVMQNQYEKFHVVSDNTNWYIIG